MYPHPQHQYVPPPTRPGHSGAALLVVGLICLGLGAFTGCVSGYAIGASPDPNGTTAATRTVTVTPSAAAASKNEASSSAPSAAATRKPAAPKQVSLPNMVGKNASIAQDGLQSLGLTNVEFSSADPSASVVLLPSNWRVTKQEPKAGTKVGLGRLVVLTVVKAS